jgi:hypothetical protein
MLASGRASILRYPMSGVNDDLSGSSSPDQMVDSQQNQCTYKRHEEAGGLVRLIVANGATKIGSQEGAGNTDEHCNEDAAGVFARHDELRNCANNEADESCPKKMKHSSSSMSFYRRRRMHRCRCGKDTPAMAQSDGLFLD